MMLALLSTICITGARAADDAWKDLKVEGYADFYYLYSFNRPASGRDLLFRQFDVKHNSMSLAAATVTVSRPTSATNPLGFTLQFTAGHNTDVANAAEPGGPEAYKHIQQAYVTYAVPGSKATVDVGKFLSWIGYEGIIAPSNDVYSNSFLFYLAQPIYHLGIRATDPLTPMLTGSLYFVNGWNEVDDSNGAKSYGATLAFAPTDKLSVTANYYGGVEGSAGVNGFYGTAGGGQSGVQLGDLIATYQVNPSLKLALNADYASVKAVDPGDPSGHFRGIAGYATEQISKTLGATIRYESVSDPDRLRSGVDGLFHSVTGTLRYDYAPNAQLRLEVRHDEANRDVFESENGPRKARTTVTLAHIFKF